jgi:EamA domain-containing membrane protein RarD
VEVNAIWSTFLNLVYMNNVSKLEKKSVSFILIGTSVLQTHLGLTLFLTVYQLLQLSVMGFTKFFHPTN